LKSPIEFYVTPFEGSVAIYEKETLKLAGIESKEALKSAFPDGGTWRKVWLKPVFGKEKTEITRHCQVADAVFGFRYDPTREPAARIAVIVEKWEAFFKEVEIEQPDGSKKVERRPLPVDINAYDALEGPVADYLSNILEAHLHPNALSHPGFIQAFSQKGSTKPSENA
jgi:hypothetical protein